MLSLFVQAKYTEMNSNNRYRKCALIFTTLIIDK